MTLRTPAKILAVLVLVLLLLAGVSFLLPASYEVSRERLVHAPPAQVHPWLDDLSRWKDWTAWGEQYPGTVYVFGAQRTGAGARSSWDDPEAGQGEIEITASDPERGVWYDLAFDGGAWRAKAAIQLAPAEGGTRVTWTMRGELGANPLARWMGLFMDRLVGPDFERGLERLDERLAGGGALLEDE